MTISFILARTTPFRVGVVFDADENLGEAAGDSAPAMAQFNEGSTGGAAGTPALMFDPLGTQGFSLGYAQISC